MTALSDTPRSGNQLWRLVAAHAVIGAQLPLHFTIGGLSGQMLADDKCWATLPISMTVIGSMTTAPWLSALMQRHGRRLGFMIGLMGSIIGSAICAMALYQGSFLLLLLGSYFIGIYMSSQGFYRFAAADVVAPEDRPKAISYVLAGGLGAAVLGPQLVKLTVDAYAIPFMGAYLAMILVALAGSFIILGINIPAPKPAQHGDTGRSRLELLRQPRILAAMICAMVSYALMNLVMTSTPLAVVGCGYTSADSADVVMAHVLGMFVPAFFTGHLIKRFGHAPIIATGLAILAGAGVIGLSGVTLMHFFPALILLGVGWNFGFIGATALLTSLQRPEEQGKVQGMNDFFVMGMVVVASMASGGLMNCSGSSPVEGWNAVNMAMAPFLLLAAGALIYYVIASRKAQSPAT